jgi:hypothetical protein
VQCFFVFVLIFALSLAAGRVYADGLFEVTLKVRGANQEEALWAAVDEAIRRSLGAVFAERSQLEGDMLEERLIQFSRGAATHYQILDSSSDGFDGSGVILTVLVTVDSVKLRENVRTLKEGAGSAGIGQRTVPHLDAGQKALSAFIKNLKYENFLEVKLENTQADVRKGLLHVTVFLSFNRKRCAAEFSEPLTKILDGIFAVSALRKEIEEEYESPEDRFAVSFYLLGENFSSRAWVLPRNFYEALRRDARFWDAGKGRVQTHKRIWLHFSLLNSEGKEIERLPVPLLASNVLFFSVERKESANPWFFMTIAESGLKNSLSLAAAPRFGSVNGQGYEFYEHFTHSFAFRLPENLLRRVGNVKVALELER